MVSSFVTAALPRVASTPRTAIRHSTQNWTTDLHGLDAVVDGVAFDDFKPGADIIANEITRSLRFGHEKQ